MPLTPAFITLTEYTSDKQITIALAHIVALQAETRRAAHQTHAAECAPEPFDECDCPTAWEEYQTRIRLSDGHLVWVHELCADILTLINARMAAVIDGADIIARAHERVTAERAAQTEMPL